MKVIAKSVALVCVAVFLAGSDLSQAAEVVRTADEAAAVAALEAMGTSVNTTDDKHPVTVVSFTKPMVIEAIVLMKKLPTLDGIDFHSSGTQGADLVGLKEIPGLKKLWLDSKQLSEAGIANLSAIPGLETLFLRGTDITDGTIEVIGKLSGLSTLHLSDTRVTTAGIQHLANFNQLSSLSIMSLDWERSHPDEPQFSDDCIRALRSGTKLKSLNLGFGTRLSDDGLKQLAEQGSNIESLQVRSDGITDMGLAQLGTIKNLKSLTIEKPFQQMRISRQPLPPKPDDVKITDEGLASLAGLTQLEQLTIHGGRFTDAGMANLGQLKQLKILSLDQAMIGDVGLEHLKDLVNLENFGSTQKCVPGVEINRTCRSGLEL